MTQKITVSGVGCCLVDRLYNNISFTADPFPKYLSVERGDGGLTPGQLVFMEEFEQFAGSHFQDILLELTHGKRPDKINIGGPSIVALIHAAQMLQGTDSVIRFYGCGGKDEDGAFLLDALKRTPVDVGPYQLSGTITPSTVVLSDPNFDQGHGERVFINSIGAAWDFSPADLAEDFFEADLVVFGGTALVPTIHDHLSDLLKKAKSKGSTTIVNTVFDFRNEKNNPKHKWPLGASDESYRNIDLLITDFEEALRLSGRPTIEDAFEFFRSQGTGAVIVTNGAKPVYLYANNGCFKGLEPMRMPVSVVVTDELKKGHSGDTTGCGDNFVGGVIASLVLQMQQGIGSPDLKEACSWGIISGGYTCFYMGGTFMEEYPGEKFRKISPLYEAYQKQLRDEA